VKRKTLPWRFVSGMQNRVLFNNKRRTFLSFLSHTHTAHISPNSSLFKGIKFLAQQSEAREKNKKETFPTPLKGGNNKKGTMDNTSLAGGLVLLRSVSIFLSNRRESKLLKEKAEKSEKKKKVKTLSKLDEQMGKLQPKMLESLKRKTHFNK